MYICREILNTMKKLLFVAGMLLMAVLPMCAQDVLVTEIGDALKVYNIEMSPSTIFYQLSDDKNAPTERIARKDVLIIRKADGTKIDPNAAETAEAPKAAAPQKKSRALVEYPKHEPVTAIMVSDITTDKEGKKVFSARTPDGRELRYAILSETEHTLAVTKGSYKEQDYIIPEYIDVNGTKYTVTEIGEKAFMNNKIFRVQFPYTLKKIGDEAFCNTRLDKIILPEGLNSLGRGAFYITRYIRGRVQELYLPVSVKTIGTDCFVLCGASISPRGFYQGFLSCMPIFITESNCKDYGIDEEAVRAYEKALER